MRTTFFSGALALLITVIILPCYAQNTVVVYTNSAAGTYGNDTASSLYLRPLNNAMVGPAAFGSGYPHAPNSYPYPVSAASEQSGILRANTYLQNSGWNSWQKDREALLQDRQTLSERVQFLEKKLSDMEKQMEEMKRMISAKESVR